MNILNFTNFILITIFSCCFFGCKKNSHLNHIPENHIGNEEYVISIIPPKDFNQFDLTPYLDSVKYVVLELTDESLIGSIDKIVIYEERIYILDTKTHSLFVFDMDGAYIHKIARVGQGPGDYTQIDFFDIDIKKKQIVLTDLMSYWVMRYDLDGKFLFKQKIPVWCYGVSILPNSGIVLYADFRNNSEKLAQEYNLIYLDSTMNYKKAYFPYNSKDFNQEIKPPASIGGQFFALDEFLNFTFPGGNTVYQITEDSLINRYQFNFGNDILPIENPTNPSQFTEQLRRKYNGFLTSVMENEEVLFFTMQTNIDLPLRFGYTVYYSKKSRNMLSAYLFMIEKFNINFPRTCYDSWIVSVMESYSLIEWKEKYPKEQISFAGSYTKARLDLAKELTDDDNPVLMFVKLKDF